jgi:hypothetical protein
VTVFFEFLKSRRFWLIALVVFGIFFAIWYSGIWNNNSGPIGGWEDVKARIEVKYADNEDMKNAALQSGEVLQKAIDYPENALAIESDEEAAYSCTVAICKLHGCDHGRSIDLEVEELSTIGAERQRRYIKYNTHLSGGVYPGIEPDLSRCKFKVIGPKK